MSKSKQKHTTHKWTITVLYHKIIKILPFFILPLQSNATLYRTGTDTSTLNFTISDSTSDYSPMATYITPTVICTEDDKLNSPIAKVRQDCSDIYFGDNLMQQSNDTVAITSLASHGLTASFFNPLPTDYPYNLPITNVATNEIYMVTLYCAAEIIGYSPLSCNAGWRPKPGQEGQPKSMKFFFLTESFDEVPQGNYTATTQFNTNDYAGDYLILRTNFNFNINVTKAASSTPTTKLFALKGNTLPIVFTTLNETSMYGHGSLEFCLQTDDYSNINLYVIGGGTYLHIAKYIGRLYLTKSESSASDGNTPSRITIAYYLRSQKLGLTGHNSLQSDCTNSNTEICLATVKTLNLSNLPDQDAPNGQTCKSFDISATTELFNPNSKLPGGYSGVFYVTLDKGT
ncbi:hypothetical protein [Shewanella nanhaiensis]|uniref:Uncharacterized protein n=1 Tax=Shewanella nanhaiensis TaxID=2864872 RepID=A0ABS7E316_9GAMM|nr:hypothetical protein [Shewanella nanhaiensis]MBW8184072.1 hypothetical protein [Shewanella nanhaiensis]